MRFFVFSWRKALKSMAVNLGVLGAVALVFCATYFGGASYVNQASTNNLTAFYNGNKAKQNVSVMINVYWGTEYLDSMLETLNKHSATATFFVGGSWVNKNQEMLKKIYNAGHEIGNHGYLHKDSKVISNTVLTEEITKTHNIVKEVIGVEMNLFAPPSGSFSKSTLSIADGLGYKTIMWSKDTIDWRDSDENLVYTRATKNLSGGDFILMHPTSHTASALDKILGFYQSNGFKAVSVTDNLKGV